MAGGVGSRFWPLSTQKTPKQFIDILGVGKTMLQQTFDRIKKIIPEKNIFVITNENYLEVTQTQLPELKKENIIGEPMMKNTAGCNLYMTKLIHSINPNALILTCPADHLILNEINFKKSIETGFSYAEKNQDLVTLGITPTRPDTGYGYIHYADEKENSILKVSQFTEKPNLETAKKFIESGNYLWNSGIFIWSAQTILNAFEVFLPEMFQIFNREKDIKKIYDEIENISIDKGILEKANHIHVIPSDLGWSDLGTWTSVYENSEKDKNQNTINSTQILTYDTSHSIIRFENGEKKAVIEGLKDFIVIDTKEALLICPKNSDQKIKNFVSDINQLNKNS